jgi:hypothetical protein
MLRTLKPHYHVHKTANSKCPELHEFSTLTLILEFTSSLPSGVLTKPLYALLFSSLRATCPAHLTRLYFPNNIRCGIRIMRFRITLIIFIRIKRLQIYLPVRFLKI